MRRSKLRKKTNLFSYENAMLFAECFYSLQLPAFFCLENIKFMPDDPQKMKITIDSGYKRGYDISVKIE